MRTALITLTLIGRVAMPVSSAMHLVGGTVAAAAQPAADERRDAHPESKLWIEGGSNVTNWSCKAATFEAHVDVDSSRAADPESTVGAEQVKRISVKVAVRNLKCGNRRMENDLYRALKATDPSTPSNILGVFDALRPSEKKESHVDTEGTIIVAGVEKGVRLRVTMERLVDGTVVARGSVPLLMTDFGVTPPTGLFGLIRSHNEIVVRFEVVVAPQTGLIAATR
jgi:polyisoprenoid-binding protein YceI